MRRGTAAKTQSHGGYEMPRKHQRGAITLPKGVHRVVARAKEYFYFQAGRGTKMPGPRVPLPKDVHAPEFWIELRKAQGDTAGPGVTTINALCDLYLASPQFLAGITASSQKQYRQHIRRVREACGIHPAAALRPKHLREMLDTMAHIPGAANSFLNVLRPLSKWGLERGHSDPSITEGGKPDKLDTGHRPWTVEQCRAAEQHLAGMVRRAYFLSPHTRQRGAHPRPPGETIVDDGGFPPSPQKTGQVISGP